MASDRLREIEENQKVLRHNIEETKRLAERNDVLLRKHRKSMNREQNA